MTVNYMRDGHADAHHPAPHGFPRDGYISVLVQIEVSSGEFIGWHTYPGLKMTYLLEGEATLVVDGQPAQAVKPGDWFQVPGGVPHSVQNGDKILRAMGTYLVGKDKPLVLFG